MTRVAAVNGEIAADPARALSAFDRGLTLGDGLFETVRVYAGTPFRLDSHLGRLRNGAERLGISFPGDLERVVDEVCEDAGRETDLALRIVLTRGEDDGDQGRSTSLVTLSDLPRFADDIYESGIRAITADGRRNEFALTAGLKTLSYADSVAALRAARSAGADDAIFRDTLGHVSEGAFSNVVAIFGKVAVSPPAECGVLPGITLAALRDLAPALGITIESRILSPPDLLAADEIMLTSSLREIVPVVAVDGATIGRGSPGPEFRRALRAYRDLARS